MSVNIGNIGIAGEDECGYVNLVQSGKRWLVPKWIVGMLHVLRIRREQIEKSLSGRIIPWCNQVFIFRPFRYRPLHIAFAQELECVFAAIEEMLRVRHAAYDRTHQHKLLNYFGMSKCEINRQLAPVRTADERNAAYLQMMQEG